MKEVKTKLSENKPEEVEAFEKGAQAFAKKVIGNFKDYEFVSRAILLAILVTLLSFPRFASTPASR